MSAVNVHPAADRFPMMDPIAFKALRESIADQGQCVACVIWKTPDGDVLLDGRNRIKACEDLGIDPEFETWIGSPKAALDYVVALNITRRNLTPAQAAAVAAELVPLYEEAAKAAHRAGSARGGKARSRANEPSRDTVAENARSAAGQAAAAMGVGRTYKTELLAIDSLTYNGVQPPWRTEGKAAMNSLKESITARGVLTPPFVASLKGKKILIDGHRRTRACQELGFKKIVCRTVEAGSLAEVEALFAELDQKTVKQRGRDRLYGWAHAADREDYLKALAPSQAGVIRSFVKIFGQTDAHVLACAGSDPSVVVEIQCADRYMRAYGESLPMRTIGNWILKFKMAATAKAAARLGGKQVAARMFRCISEDRAMTFRPKPSV
jgi:ParB-like chromosome segregation protein Spo0J